MKVKELIDELSLLDENKEVYTYKEHDYGMNGFDGAYERVYYVTEDGDMVILETEK